ncbi:MAG TPA: helix-turn-helix domain-containing protein [Candidatus Limnocylindria bacterium]|jgi:hypothetical protein
MTSLLDVWRAIDPSARLISGTVEQLSRPVRGVTRTRAAPPHLPPLSPGHVLFVDGAVVPPAGLDALIGAVHDAALEPVGLWMISEHPAAHEPTSDELPVLLGGGPAGSRTDAAAAYLDAEAASLAAIASELRLLAAEAALADPQPRAPSGVVAAHLRRGVAVSVDGALASLTPRSAGRALATRFAATHARLLGERAASLGAARRTRDGLWIVGRPITDGSAAWLFDDLPFARVDEVALEALAVTLRALLRRRPEPEGARRAPTLPPSSGDALRDTLLAVARANGRVTPAARALGVHRNTVLYRLRRASAELGIDPRRPDDALRLLEAANRD